MSEPWIDPAMAPILARMRAAPAVDYPAMPSAEGRVVFDRLAASWNAVQPGMARVSAWAVPRPDGTMRALLYEPAGASGGLVIHVHGGGWTFGSIESHERAARLLAREAGVAVLAVDYRLAPEHPHPAGVEDTLAAIGFAETGGLGAPVPAARIALAGDSAGANIAYAAMLARRDRGLPLPATAALFYGCFAPDFDTASHARFGDGSYGLSTERMRWYWGNHLGAEPVATTSLAAPLRADPAGLPPLYLNAAGLDPLLDDTLLLSAKLAAAGVRHRFDAFPGVVHGFMQMSAELPAAGEAIAAAGDHIRRALDAA